MLISIIIPVYKVEEYIERCIQSVISQDYQGDLECLLIDDCTPDNSCAVIEDILDKYDGPIKFRLLHHEKNRGLSAARNTGIDNAQGDYIYFLDSDDYISSDCISKLSALLSERDYDIVIGNYTTLGTDVLFPPLKLGNRQLIHNDDIIESYTLYEWYMMAWNKLCNLSFIRNHSLYFMEGLIQEDELWSFQCACSAKSLISIDSNTYYYCIRESSIIGSKGEWDRKRQSMVILGYMQDYISQNHLFNPRYLGFVQDRYGVIKNETVRDLCQGKVINSIFLKTFWTISKKLGYNNSAKNKAINYLIYRGNSKWASVLLKYIHKIVK